MRKFMHRDSIRRVVRTFVAAFLGLWIPLLLGFLQQLAAWAADNGTHPFPSMGSLAYGAVSAVSAACIALVSLLWNAWEDKTGKTLPGVLAKPRPVRNTYNT